MSVFTYDMTPARVSSPWLRPTDSTAKEAEPQPPSTLGRAMHLTDYGITKLPPEPQDGPTEYKLHLLLKARRPYDHLSTTTKVSEFAHLRAPYEQKPLKYICNAPGASGPSYLIRQDRLEHLTTQLLWRLQQSCPYHASSASLTLTPQLPDEMALNEPLKPAKLTPGIEASQGALYEIGVADDGALVGLTNAEMEESLKTLGAMAASLGCNVQIMKRILVGDCEWSEKNNGTHIDSFLGEKTTRRQEDLWVVEALVKPDLGTNCTSDSPNSRPTAPETLPDLQLGPWTTNQLRVTLTGPTMSGKSTLLGVLSTGTLDNGRGSIRPNLLKHRHELASGVTSSVAQEIVGYHDRKIISYADQGVESWIDIHDFTKNGRLVHLLDSAGDIRYRRTIVRGIVGWAPHWVLYCIAANEEEHSEILAESAMAHLNLCLQLDVPLAVVMTKMDMASKLSICRVLSRVLTSIKSADRAPKVLPLGDGSTSALDHVSERDMAVAKSVLDTVVQQSGSLLSTVPIILTSAVNGTGVSQLHALLQQLPLPPSPTSHDYIGDVFNPEQPASLFHIQETYSLPASYALAAGSSSGDADLGTVVAGHLRFGSLSIGDRILIGPFQAKDLQKSEDYTRVPTLEARRSPRIEALSMSNPFLSSNELSRIAQSNPVSASASKGEWHNASIVSIRNLRLPVHALKAGEVGSIGIVFDSLTTNSEDDTFLAMLPRLRKGMVLAIPSHHMVETRVSLQAASGLAAVFQTPGVASLGVGNLVNIYVASVRATARVVSRRRTFGDPEIFGERHIDWDERKDDDGDGVFMLDELGGDEPGAALPGVTVRFEFLTNREWVELGSRVLVLGSKEQSRLEGYVGRIVEIAE